MLYMLFPESYNTTRILKFISVISWQIASLWSLPSSHTNAHTHHKQHPIPADFYYAHMSLFDKFNFFNLWISEGPKELCGTSWKTCLYNFDPLKPHFYIVKLGFTGVYIIFLISAQNIDCWYSLELPHRGSSNEYPQSMFCAEIWKISEFFTRKFSFFGGKIFNIVE